ncbi:hypothetical protein KTE57_28480, partial [Burkholderia multivorans]|uniref:hypothetical protein n=2 Tax=Burkholderia multivorans TaxID=87883 RepID=UPI001C223FBA
MFAFSAVGNTDACVVRRRMSRPEAGFAITPTVTGVVTGFVSIQSAGAGAVAPAAALYSVRGLRRAADRRRRRHRAGLARDVCKRCASMRAIGAAPAPALARRPRAACACNAATAHRVAERRRRLTR